MTRFRAAAVVTADRVLRPGWVDVTGDRIVGLGVADGTSAPYAGDVIDLGDVVIVPGFVDLHCHGGGGAGFGDGPDAARTAAAAHLVHGTTTLMASLVSGPRDGLLRQITALSLLVDDGVLAGVHLEGPWLSTAYCGAHEPAQLRPPTADEVDQLVGQAAVRMVTVAPELDGGLDAVRRIADLGAIAALGHTDADHATTEAAIAAGARHATHLFNAMRPLRHRDPGPVLALLEHDEVTLELIRDGVHLDPALCAWLDATTAPHRLVAVTDAMAAAGSADGRYSLGALEIDVADSVAHVVGTTTIAGSTATMDRLFRTIVGSSAGGDTSDATDDALLRAARQTGANPARVLGCDDLGVLAPGARADLVALDSTTLEVRRVMRAGEWIDASPTSA